MDQNETKHWEDTGCEVSSSCLECPLPACKLDDPAAYQAYRRGLRDAAIANEIESLGMSIEEASAKYHVTVRTVFRIKERARKEIGLAW